MSAPTASDTNGRVPAGTRRAPLSERAARHPLGLGIAALIAAALIAYASWVVTEGVPFLQKYSIKAVLPPEGPIVRKGIEVRVGGERAGKVTEVEQAAAGRLVTMRLSNDTPVHADGSATLHIRGLAGASYIDLHLGSSSRKLPSGATIPRARNQSGEDLAEVAAGFGPQARAALSRTLQAYGGGLTATGEPLNRAIEDLGPLTRDGRRLLGALAPTPTALEDLFSGLGRLSTGFAGTGTDAMGRLIVAGNASLTALDRRRGDLATTLRRAVPFEDAVTATLPDAAPVLRDVAATSRTLSPGLQALARALPTVNRLLDRADDLSRISQLTHAAAPVLVAARPLLDRVVPLAQVIHPTVAPLVPLARYMDPYRTDVVQALANLASTGANKYAEGLASGSRAIRFTPIFTCMGGRTVYPAPDKAITERESAPCR